MENLCDWLARQPREIGTSDKSARLAHSLHLGRLIDERESDHIGVRGDLRRSWNSGPLLRTRRLVQCRNKSVEREVAVLAETARVLNLFQANYLSVQCVDCRDNLLLLALEGSFGICATLFALVRGHKIALAILVAVFTLPLRASGSEVVEHIERCDVDVAL